MKCQKCNESFKIIGLDKEHMGTCPKCGEKIVPMPNAFESIPEAIYYCIMVGSKEPFDILNSKTKLNSYLEDTLGSSYPERNMVKAAIDSDIGSVLFKAKGSTNSARKEAFDEAVDMMHRSYGTELSIARKTVKYFTDAMGWDIVIEQPKQSASTSDKPVVNNTAARPAPVSPANNVNVRPKLPKQNVPVNPAMANNTQNRVQAPPPQQTNYNNGYTQQMPVEPKKKKKGCLGFFLILTFLILAAIAFLLFKIFLSNDNSDDSFSVPESSISQSIDVDDTETDVTTENDDTTNEESATQTTSKEKTTTSKDDEEQPTSDKKAAETGKYTVRSLSGYIDYEGKNQNEHYYYDNFDVDTENNVLYYSLGDTIYTVDLNTGDSKSSTKIDAYNEGTNCSLYLVYNQYAKKMYCFLDDNYKLYAYDVSTDDAALLFNIDISLRDNHVLSFTSSNMLSVCESRDSYRNYVYEINLTDQSDKKGYISNEWNCFIKNSKGETSVADYMFYKFLPILKNDCYYWIESTNGEGKGTTAVCYTMKSISNDEDNCGQFIGLFENTISQCVTDNDAYIMTQDFSIYKIDVENLLNTMDNHFEEDNKTVKNPDFSDSLELIIGGKDIKQTGLKSISEPTGLRMTTDGRFVVFDKFDNTFKIVEKKQ